MIYAKILRSNAKNLNKSATTAKTEKPYPREFLYLIEAKAPGMFAVVCKEIYLVLVRKAKRQGS